MKPYEPMSREAKDKQKARIIGRVERRQQANRLYDCCCSIAILLILAFIATGIYFIIYPERWTLW